MDDIRCWRRGATAEFSLPAPWRWRRVHRQKTTGQWQPTSINFRRPHAYRPIAVRMDRFAATCRRGGRRQMYVELILFSSNRSLQFGVRTYTALPRDAPIRPTDGASRQTRSISGICQDDSYNALQPGRHHPSVGTQLSEQRTGDRRCHRETDHGRGEGVRRPIRPLKSTAFKG